MAKANVTYKDNLMVVDTGTEKYYLPPSCDIYIEKPGEIQYEQLLVSATTVKKGSTVDSIKNELFSSIGGLEEEFTTWSATERGLVSVNAGKEGSEEAEEEESEEGSVITAEEKEKAQLEAVESHSDDPGIKLNDFISKVQLVENKFNQGYPIYTPYMRFIINGMTFIDTTSPDYDRNNLLSLKHDMNGSGQGNKFTLQISFVPSEKNYVSINQLESILLTACAITTDESAETLKEGSSLYSNCVFQYGYGDSPLLRSKLYSARIINYTCDISNGRMIYNIEGVCGLIGNKELRISPKKEYSENEDGTECDNPLLYIYNIFDVEFGSRCTNPANKGLYECKFVSNITSEGATYQSNSREDFRQFQQNNLFKVIDDILLGVCTAEEKELFDAHLTIAATQKTVFGYYMDSTLDPANPNKLGTVYIYKRPAEVYNVKAPEGEETESKPNTETEETGDEAQEQHKVSEEVKKKIEETPDSSSTNTTEMMKTPQISFNWFGATSGGDGALNHVVKSWHPHFEGNVLLTYAASVLEGKGIYYTMDSDGNLRSQDGIGAARLGVNLEGSSAPAQAGGTDGGTSTGGGGVTYDETEDSIVENTGLKETCYRDSIGNVYYNEEDTKLKVYVRWRQGQPIEDYPEGWTSDEDKQLWDLAKDIAYGMTFFVRPEGKDGHYSTYPENENGKSPGDTSKWVTIPKDRYWYFNKFFCYTRDQRLYAFNDEQDWFKGNADCKLPDVEARIESTLTKLKMWVRINGEDWDFVTQRLISKEGDLNQEGFVPDWVSTDHYWWEIKEKESNFVSHFDRNDPKQFKLDTHPINYNKDAFYKAEYNNESINPGVDYPKQEAPVYGYKQDGENYIADEQLYKTKRDSLLKNSNSNSSDNKDEENKDNEENKENENKSIKLTSKTGNTKDKEEDKDKDENKDEEKDKSNSSDKSKTKNPIKKKLPNSDVEYIAITQDEYNKYSEIVKEGNYHFKHPSDVSKECFYAKNGKLFIKQPLIIDNTLENNDDDADNKLLEGPYPVVKQSEILEALKKHNKEAWDALEKWKKDNGVTDAGDVDITQGDSSNSDDSSGSGDGSNGGASSTIQILEGEVMVNTIQEYSNWSRLTQYPYKADLELLGVPSDCPVMSCIRINAYMGHELHHSSGNYIILNKTDNIDSGGFRTTLNLSKITKTYDPKHIVKQSSDVVLNEGEDLGAGWIKKDGKYYQIIDDMLIEFTEEQYKKEMQSLDMQIKSDQAKSLESGKGPVKIDYHDYIRDASGQYKKKEEVSGWKTIQDDIEDANARNDLFTEREMYEEDRFNLNVNLWNSPTNS